MGAVPARTGAGLVRAIDVEGRLQGVIELRKADWRVPSAEIGYLVAPWARGQGLVRRATEALSTWALAQGVARLELRVATGNLTSLRTARRDGFREEPNHAGIEPTQQPRVPAGGPAHQLADTSSRVTRRTTNHSAAALLDCPFQDQGPAPPALGLRTARRALGRSGAATTLRALESRAVRGRTRRPTMATMRLARLAVVELSPRVELPAKATMLNSGQIRIQMQPVPGEKHRLLVTATIQISDAPPFDSAGNVLVPQSPRVGLEAAIHEVADLASIAGGGPRRIFSILPEFGFFDLTVEDQALFATHAPLSVPQPIHFRLASAFHPLLFHDLPFDALSDRPDGVRLLAEALSSTHPTGRFRELCRLFERAFAVGPHELVARVATFLRPYRGLDFSSVEVAHWFDQLRHLATHADRREQFAVASDVAPHLPRIEFAAYDVLLNKAAWRESGSLRRSIWDPPIAPLPDGDAALRADGAAPLQWEVFDCFGVFPLDTSHRIGLPEGWVVHLPTDRVAPSGNITVMKSLMSGLTED